MELEDLKEGKKGILSIDADIFEVTPSFHSVEVKKSDGDTLEYQKIWNEEMSPTLQDQLFGTPVGFVGSDAIVLTPCLRLFNSIVLLLSFCYFATHRRHDAVVIAMLCSAPVSGSLDSGYSGGSVIKLNQARNPFDEGNACSKNFAAPIKYCSSAQQGLEQQQPFHFLSSHNHKPQQPFSLLAPVLIAPSPI
ncbi:hypothetical protein RIF29_08614 [Crotalaria pallida]|uniref:Uncharacterized protein n=1 Tax=Crotalaria pallida TaxID=3830 RepID=A0AAN9FXA4_CROPI